MQAGSPILILDATVLINFLAVDRADLLGRLATPVLVTEHVVGEVSGSYAEQRERLAIALDAGLVTQIRITDLKELEEFAKLTSSKPSKRRTFGEGECSAIAVAVHRGYELGIDDKPAIKLVRTRYPDVVIRQTFELVMELIRGNAVTVLEADRLKNEWGTKHGYILKHFSSFSELI